MLTKRIMLNVPASSEPRAECNAPSNGIFRERESRMRRVLSGVILVCGLMASPFVAAQSDNESRPNVLFIAVDDLRPQLNCYGRTMMQTPHIDQLAARGVLFERAYCMVPTCGASRAALMTSVRPTPDRFRNYLTWAEKDAPDAVPINSHFRRNEYTTISLGKVFHHRADCVEGWSEPPWRSKKSSYQKMEQFRKDVAAHRRQYPGKSRHRGAPFEAAPAPDADYPDADCATRATEYLERFAKEPSQPFFLAVGFLKPHLPFNAPQQYWDLYEHEAIQLPDNYHAPRDAPKAALHNSGELRAYAGIHPNRPVDEATARNLIHGYYACVSFIDAQVGRLMDSLDELGLAENTVVVLWGDHGWQLGEHGMWNKHSCFETSMHAPLIVVAPQSTGARRGSRVSALTEFIDIYPSLCELCDLPIPAHVQGTSFVGLLRDPEAEWKEFAVGRFQSGDTIRSATHRYSEYSSRSGSVTDRMLYDHTLDPAENINIAGDASAGDTIRQLSNSLSDIRKPDE